MTICKGKAVHPDWPLLKQLQEQCLGSISLAVPRQKSWLQWYSVVFTQIPIPVPSQESAVCDCAVCLLDCTSLLVWWSYIAALERFLLTQKNLCYLRVKCPLWSAGHQIKSAVGYEYFIFCHTFFMEQKLSKVTSIVGLLLKIDILKTYVESFILSLIRF